MTRPTYQEEKNQQQYYNQIAAEYNLYYHNPYALQYRHEIYGRVLNNLHLAGGAVLDAMCGGGQNSAYFIGMDVKLYGFDISYRQCQHYQRQYPHYGVFCGSIFSTGFASEAFDLIVLDSLHHTHPQINLAFTELLRILKPGGHILLWEPNAQSLVDKLRMLWYRMDKRYFQANEKAINLDDLVADFGNVTVINREVGGHIAYWLVFSSMILRIPIRLLPYYAPHMLRLEHGLDKLGLNQVFSSWVLALLQKKAP